MGAFALLYELCESNTAQQPLLSTLLTSSQHNPVTRVTQAHFTGEETEAHGLKQAASHLLKAATWELHRTSDITDARFTAPHTFSSEREQFTLSFAPL